MLDLRSRLIGEEAKETLIAITQFKDSACDKLPCKACQDNITEVVDGCVDTLVVVIGTLIALGVDVDSVWDEVHRSNMSKFVDGKAIRDEGGKILKGPNYFKPNLRSVIFPSTD